jgi:hypothetical protein
MQVKSGGFTGNSGKRTRVLGQDCVADGGSAGLVCFRRLSRDSWMVLYTTVKIAWMIHAGIVDRTRLASISGSPFPPPGDFPNASQGAKMAIVNPNHRSPFVR